MKHKIKLCLFIALQFAIMIAIFSFSSQSGEVSQQLSDGLLSKLRPLLAFLPKIEIEDRNNIRKWAHIFEFMCLGASSFMLAAEIFIKSDKRFLISPLLAVLFSALYAVTDEIHQFYIPGRACRLRDILIDSSGAVAGAAAMTIIYLLINRKAGLFDNEQKPHSR